MRFKLQDSPFRNIHKYHDDDVLDYLDVHLREYAWQHHEQRRSPVPPGAFVFGETQGSFVQGFAHPTPASFIEQVKYETRHLNARRVVLLAEVNSLSAPEAAALLAVEVQTPDHRVLRCAYDLLRPGRIAIRADWTFDPAEEEKPLDALDPVVQMVEESTKASRLVGVTEFFRPVFSNPPDSVRA